jgi:uncharacterized repeat protein (TIGR03847 family)
VLIELDPVDRITAGAVGPPGERVFYLQGRRGDQLVTVLVEKQQVQLLSSSVVEILARIGKETGQGPSEDLMSLDEPLIPEWRAGRISIGYHDERDLLMLEAEELLPEEEQDEDEEGTGPEERTEPPPEDAPVEGPPRAPQPEGPDSEAREAQRIRFWATREQMLSLARHGAAVCAAGRPRCQLCGNPIDPEGHQCPALNGQGRSTEA